MKKLLAVIVFIVSTFAQAQSVDMKGVHLGMTREEVLRIVPDAVSRHVAGEIEVFSLPDHYTLAGIDMKSGALQFGDGKLIRYGFEFKSINFRDMIAALQQKYPGISCTSTPWRPVRGLVIDTHECSYKELLVTERNIAADIANTATSTLLLVDRNYRSKEQVINLQRAKGDL